jgi:hypothetical protein
MFDSILFFAYWIMALMLGMLCVRILFKQHDWKLQISAMLVLIPAILRVLFLK